MAKRTVIDTLKACAAWLGIASNWNISEKTQADLAALREEVLTHLGHAGAVVRTRSAHEKPGPQPATPVQVLELISEWHRGCTNTLGGRSAAECRDCTIGLIEAIAERVSAFVVMTGEAQAKPMKEFRWMPEPIRVRLNDDDHSPIVFIDEGHIAYTEACVRAAVSDMKGKLLNPTPVSEESKA